MSKSRSFHELQKQVQVANSKHHRINHHQVSENCSSEKKAWNCRTVANTKLNKGLLGKNCARSGSKKHRLRTQDTLAENLTSISMQQAELNYFQNYKEIQQILHDKAKRSAPQNASASINVCKASFCVTLVVDCQPKHRYRSVGRRPATNMGVFGQRKEWSREGDEANKTSYKAPAKHYYRTSETIDKPDNKHVYFKSEQNVYTRLMTSSKCSRKSKYVNEIESLIEKCKEAETEDKGESECMERKPHFDKEADRVQWAIKEYLSNISSAAWQSGKDIGFLLRLKNAKRASKKALFNAELVAKIHRNMTKRALFMSTFGKKKIWKPQRYVPSRQVILANSIEELNNLYRIDGEKKR